MLLELSTNIEPVSENVLYKPTFNKRTKKLDLRKSQKVKHYQQIVKTEFLKLLKVRKDETPIPEDVVAVMLYLEFGIKKSRFWKSDTTNFIKGTEDALLGRLKKGKPPPLFLVDDSKVIEAYQRKLVSKEEYLRSVIYFIHKDEKEIIDDIRMKWLLESIKSTNSDFKFIPIK
jgi:hypothetical protein